MKNAITALSLTLVMGSAVATTDKQELKRELEIMSSVMQTAIKQSDRRGPIRISSIESTYLANQGVVFTFSTNNRGQALFIDLDGLAGLLPPKAPLPPISMSSSGDGLVLEFKEQIETLGQEAAAQIRESLEQTADTLRQLRSNRRDTAWEKRELEREIRDIEFQIRTVTGKSKEELEQEQM